MEKFAILVDSGSDVPKKYLDKYPIYVAPLSICYSDGTYLDGVDISPEEVTARFEQEIPKTSLPSIESIQNLIRKIKADGFSQIMVITISSGLSGTFNAIKVAAEEFSELKFKFIDTKNIGIGSGMQAVLAAKLQETGLSMQESFKKVHDNILNTKVFFCIPTLDYLRKGGRIGLVTSFVGTALGLKPVITCNEDGIYKTLTKARGWKNAITTALEISVKQALDCTKYNIAIAHSDAEDEAKSILKKLKELLPNASTSFFGTISPALTVHTGPGLIGIGIQKLETSK